MALRFWSLAGPVPEGLMGGCETLIIFPSNYLGAGSHVIDA